MIWHVCQPSVAPYNMSWSRWDAKSKLLSADHQVSPLRLSKTHLAPPDIQRINCGFPIKNVIILVVTLIGRGDNPTNAGYVSPQKTTPATVFPVLPQASVCSGHFSVSEISVHSRLTQLSRKSFSKRILSSKDQPEATDTQGGKDEKVYLEEFGEH